MRVTISKARNGKQVVTVQSARARSVRLRRTVVGSPKDVKAVVLELIAESTAPQGRVVAG